MNNKRFWLDESGIHDKEYEFVLLGEDELVDIINALHDENEKNKRIIQKQEVELSKVQSILQKYYNSYKDNNLCRNLLLGIASELRVVFL